MAIKRYDVVAVTGSYIDRNGQERRRYMNCGAVFETEKGLSPKLEAVPLGSDGWFQLCEVNSEQQRPAPRNAAGRPAAYRKAVAAAAVQDDFDDEIPF
ncbi:MAG: hypothetical protein GX093_05240 [Xanthomonadaceae bacterium]|nr:hypothetical protein [Xanthomonadaceae bacterium]